MLTAVKIKLFQERERRNEQVEKEMDTKRCKRVSEGEKDSKM
jgi:Tfp pilus assembly major pilin PilA